MWPFGKKAGRPTAEDAARRLIVLKYVAVAGLSAPTRDQMSQMIAGMPPDERTQFERRSEQLRDGLWQGLRSAGLWSYLSPNELPLRGAPLSL